MVAVPYAAEAQSHSAGWQGIRQQLFGQKRERDAEDGLLSVITQLQTRLAIAIGANEGPLRSPALRAQALRAVQEGLNDLIGWHRTQLDAARAVGAWGGAPFDLARDVLGAVQEMRPLFEGAEVRSGSIDARDLAESVAQLRGTESDVFFNDALDGLVGMLDAVYVRIGVDAPTAPTAYAMNETWAVLVDELRALACPVEEIRSPEPVVVAELALVAQTTAPAVVRATEPESEPDLTSVAFFSPQSERDVPAEEPRLIVFPRFFRLELVAC